MRRLNAPQSIVPKKRDQIQANDDCFSEFEGEVQSPIHKAIDLGSTIIANYKNYEEKMTHVSAPILAWLGWTILVLLSGVLLGYYSR